MKQHISSLCRTTFLALRRIASISPFLSNSSIEKLVASMITSRLDYCNAAFAGAADEQITRIQKIQNNAAWLILKKLKRDHVTPLLKELHWLPVKYYIQYKLTMLTFCHFDGTLLPYPSSSLCTYQPLRSLRSSTERLLKIPKTNLKTFGEHSFGYTAPTVWNSLLRFASGAKNKFAAFPWRDQTQISFTVSWEKLLGWNILPFSHSSRAFGWSLLLKKFDALASSTRPFSPSWSEFQLCSESMFAPKPVPLLQDLMRMLS